MVLVSLFCCVWGGPDDHGGGRGSARAKHHVESNAQYSVLHKTENNSSPQSKKAINGCPAGARRAPDMGAQLETRPPVQGGECGGRVSFAACRALGAAVTDQEGLAGGELASPIRSAGGQRDRVRSVSPGDASLRISAGLERRPLAASLETPSGIAAPLFQMRKRQSELRQLQHIKVHGMQTAAGFLRRPPAISEA